MPDISPTFEGRFLVCRPDQITCPRCSVPRRGYALPGDAIAFCDNRVPGAAPGQRCGTHLLIRRAYGEQSVLVIALRSAFDRDRLIALLDPSEGLPSSA